MESTIPRSLARSLARRWPLAALALVLSGCVHVYQPMYGLQQPVVVDPTAANLEGVRITLRCYPGDALNDMEADDLCDKVSALFENQGATVTLASSVAFRDEPTGDQAQEAPPAADLVVELRARELHKSNDTLRWFLCIGTYTLVPAITEYTFAQDVTVRDGGGLLLARESMSGRMIRYFGLGTWASNVVLNLVWRDEEDKIEADTAQRELSDDLYRQLSQVVYNAKVQWQVSQRAAAEGAP
ncbi:MAG: hypothetical protein H6741_31435 [Alphaproteobacteria bacterium]|nr:hypothetical protein [Alphaproteobacteria bacterium]